MIGLKRGIVYLAPHCPGWAGLFQAEAAFVKSLLGDAAVDIQHIGSTSIPDICAKPIIDMLVGVDDLSNVSKWVPMLERNGYIYRPDSGCELRILFVKGGEDCRTHHIHFVDYNGTEWRRHVFFRNFLREHRDAAEAYQRLKKQLAETYPADRKAYTDGKAEFIEGIIKQMC